VSKNIPIEQIPLGARIPTKNPKPWEYDDSLPEPDQATWAKVSITMHRNDGGIVDAELLRPRWWIAQHNIVAGKLLPMNIEELQVHGSAIVTSIDECPEIAGGEGRVVTATFKTREVNTIVRAEIIGPDGTIEKIEGTPIHPIWSVDRNDWVPLGELIEGETLQASNGIATVLSLALVTCSVPVYNIEVHGEHVYQVGELGLLVHNAYPTDPIEGGRGLWNLTKDGASKLMKHGEFGTFFKSKSDGLWWAVDNAEHGGSAFKVFKETGKGLEWIADADKYGDFIVGKHKGPTGLFIPWKHLRGL
jgi:hypothetical protein